MNKKKILIVINSLDCGGAEKSLVSMLPLLDYRKYEVYIQMFKMNGVFQSLLPKEVTVLPEIQYLKFCKKSVIQQILSFNYQWIKTRISTRQSIKTNLKHGKKLHDSQAYWKGCCDAFDTLSDQYDVAIAWGQGNPTHFVADKVKARKKIAWINVDYQAVGYNEQFDYKYYNRMDKIITVSKDLENKVKRVYPDFTDKIETILDIQNYRLIEEMAKEPIELQYEIDGTFRLVTVGRLVPLKGYDIAVNAANILKERGFKFNWYVIGDGPSRKSIEEMIDAFKLNDCFHLMGTKANPYPYMKSADIYVQTSKHEGYCLTLAEARMLNIPCVTTEFDVVYSQMVPNENGLVVKIEPLSVANGIQQLMENNDLYKHIIQYQQNEKKGNCEEIIKIERLFDDE